MDWLDGEFSKMWSYKEKKKKQENIKPKNLQFSM